MKLSELMTKRLDGYNGTNAKHKSDFHRLAKRQLKSLAMALMLPPGSYEVRDNRGGMAVSGECTLHTNTFYCQIAQSHMGQGSEVMYRSCKGRKDYTGGANHFAPAYVLAKKMMKNVVRNSLN